MATEDRDRTPPNGRDAASVPAIVLWWSILVIMAGGAGFGVLSGALYLTFDLPRDSFSFPGIAAMLILAAAANWARPRTFRQMAIVAAVGATSGVLVMLCYLPAGLYAQGLEGTSGSFMVRLLAAALTASVGISATLLALRRLAARWAAQNQAADPTNSNAP